MDEVMKLLDYLDIQSPQAREIMRIREVINEILTSLGLVSEHVSGSAERDAAQGCGVVSRHDACDAQPHPGKAVGSHRGYLTGCKNGCIV